MFHCWVHHGFNTRCTDNHLHHALIMFIKTPQYGIPVSVIQAVVVLVPTYAIAYLTDKMVYTIPMLAAMSFVAARIGRYYEEDATKRTDDGIDA